MITYISKTQVFIKPFTEPADKIRIGNTTIQELRKSTLENLKINYLEIEDKLRLDTSCDDCLVINDNVLFSEELISAFLRQASQHAVSQCYTIKNIFSWCASDSESENFEPLGIFYIPKGKNLSDEITRVNIKPEKAYSHPMMLPAKIFNSMKMSLNFCLIYGTDLNIWPDVLLANSLVCRKFCLDKLRPLEKLVLKSPLVRRIVSSPRIISHMNKKGTNCDIHPTAILEGCVIGNNVRIGAYCRVRTSMIGDNCHITDNSVINTSAIGEHSYVARTEMFNCLIGADSLVVTEKLFNTIIGNETFVGGQTSFADFNITRKAVTIDVEGERIQTPYVYLGCCVGNKVSVGGDMSFSPGVTVPSNSSFLNNSFISEIPEANDCVFVQTAGAQLIKIPKALL